jgi:hypothetical protein
LAFEDRVTEFVRENLAVHSLVDPLGDAVLLRAGFGVPING